MKAKYGPWPAKKSGYCPVDECRHDHKISAGQMIVKLENPVKKYLTGRGGKIVPIYHEYAHFDCPTVEL